MTDSKCTASALSDEAGASELAADPAAETCLLSFGDDLQDDISHQVEIANYWASFEVGNPLKHYLVGDAYVMARTTIGAGEYDLLLAAIPIGIDTFNVAESGPFVPKFCCDEKAVFVRITKLIQCVEGMVPSRVWLERSKNREDFRRQVPSPGLAGNGDAFPTIIPKREVGVCGVVLPEKDCGRISTLIEGSAKVVSSISGDALQSFGWLLSPSELMKLLSISVYFGDGEPWLRVEKFGESRIKILDVVLPSLIAPFRAIEGVLQRDRSHDSCSQRTS